jgi:uncharacterized membrane protein YqaE (UPF0057 family)
VEPLDTIDYFVKEISWIEKVGKNSMAFMVVLAILLPPVLFYFGAASAVKIISSNNVFSTRIINSLFLPFLAVTLSTNIVISLLFDEELTMWRPGLSILLMGLAGSLILL